MESLKAQWTLALCQLSCQQGTGSNPPALIGIGVVVAELLKGVVAGVSLQGKSKWRNNPAHTCQHTFSNTAEERWM
jgi:hypothetical protein